MAKKPSSQPKLSAEEQKAKLDALTAGIAAVGHVGPTSITTPPAPAAAPAPSPPAAVPEPETSTVAEAVTVTPAAEAITVMPATQDEASPVVDSPPTNEPTSEQAATVDSAADNPAVAAVAASTPIESPATPTELEQEGKKEPAGVTIPPVESVDKQAADEVKPEPDAATQAADLTEDGKLNLASLFLPPSDKRTFQVRITPELQQFFQQIGTILGNGASSADIIHNILTQFRAQHGAQIGRALQKELRKMLNSKP